MIKKFFWEAKVLAIETVILTFLPLAIIRIFPDLLVYRFWLMSAGLIYIGIFCRLQKITLKLLGWRPENIRLGLKPNLAIVIPAALAVIGLIWVLPAKWIFPVGVSELFLEPIWLNPVRYIFISVPLQEMIYRSYLINRANLVFRRRLWVKLYAAVIFGSVHLPFRAPFLVFGTTSLGWFWAGSFLKHRNLYAVMISHALIGLIYFALFLFYS